jgi:hypothetical protein
MRAIEQERIAPVGYRAAMYRLGRARFIRQSVKAVGQGLWSAGSQVFNNPTRCEIGSDFNAATSTGSWKPLQSATVVGGRRI